MAAKKLRDFPPTLLEALIETLEAKCPGPDLDKPIITDMDKWEHAIQQGRRAALADVRGALATMRKRKKNTPAPLVEDAE